MIPMKYEERNPMKQLQTLCTKALMLFISAVSVCIFITIIIQLISLSFYTVLLIVALATLGYIFRSYL